MTMRFLTFTCALLFSFGAHAAGQSEASESIDLVASSPMLANTLPGAIQNLVNYAVSYEGVSYIRGGTNPDKGFDCSGFVRYVFGRAEGVALPHSAKALSEIGSRIKISEMLPGDLVFFRTLRNRISHVGIYLGIGEFIHASSTRTGSVMISNLKDRYWTKHFSLVRRLDAPNDAVKTEIPAVSAK